MLADMDREVRNIELEKSDGSRVEATLTFWTESPGDPKLVELYLETEAAAYSVIERDFWAALVGLREILEPQGLRPVVYGASRNTTPSDKSRESGYGMHVYRMTPGRLAVRDDLVHIFDTGPDVDPALIEEQQAFAERWFDSLQPRS